MCGCPPQVYRHSVMAQWRALELDVLLTPMLGPALDLNGPGKATGEDGSPITSLSPVSSLQSSALCLVGLLGSRRRGALGEDSTLIGSQSGWLERWESGGMPWEGMSSSSSAIFKLEVLLQSLWFLGSGV